MSEGRLGLLKQPCGTEEVEVETCRYNSVVVRAELIFSARSLAYGGATPGWWIRRADGGAVGRWCPAAPQLRAGRRLLKNHRQLTRSVRPNSECGCSQRTGLAGRLRMEVMSNRFIRPPSSKPLIQ